MRRPIMESLHPTLEQHVFNDPELTAAWDSLRRAEVHFRYRGFVGRGYYLTKWRDPNMPTDVAHREQLLTQLIELGVVEQYTVDCTTALRTALAPPQEQPGPTEIFEDDDATKDKSTNEDEAKAV
jgi:hypothetical protein